MVNKSHFFSPIAYIIEGIGDIPNKLYPWALNKSGGFTSLSRTQCIIQKEILL